MAVEEELTRVVRDEGARLLATLIRTVGDFSIAEEAVQEAAIAALRHWSAYGLPDEPRAWLTTTARRKAIDIIRRERVRVGKERAGAELMELHQPGPPEPQSDLDDDLLRFGIALVAVAVLGWALWRSNRMGGVTMGTPPDEPPQPNRPNPHPTTSTPSS